MSADIIAMLEKATGPDRELDKMICLSFGWTLQKMKGDRQAYYRKPGVTDWYLRSNPPAYTASLDAALALVGEQLPVAALSMAGNADSGWLVRLFTKADGWVSEARSTIFPVAVLLALFRALETA